MAGEAGAKQFFRLVNSRFFTGIPSPLSKKKNKPTKNFSSSTLFIYIPINSFKIHSLYELTILQTIPSEFFHAFALFFSPLLPAVLYFDVWGEGFYVFSSIIFPNFPQLLPKIFISLLNMSFHFISILKWIGWSRVYGRVAEKISGSMGLWRNTKSSSEKKKQSLAERFFSSTWLWIKCLYTYYEHTSST